MHPGLRAWAHAHQQRGRAFSAWAESATELGLRAREPRVTTTTALDVLAHQAELKHQAAAMMSTLLPPQPEGPGLCQIHGCDSPAAYHDPEHLCPDHLRNLWSWTRRDVVEKVPDSVPVASKASVHVTIGSPGIVG